MLTPSVRSCSMLAAALVASVVLTAAPAFAQAGKPAPATPQAALDALEAAIAARRCPGGDGPPHAGRPEALAKDAVMDGPGDAGVHGPGRSRTRWARSRPRRSGRKEKAYAEAKTAITAALKPSGMDAAMGKPLMPAMEIVDAKIGTADAATVVPRYGTPSSRRARPSA